VNFFSNIEQFLKDKGYPAYRLQQLYTNIFQNRIVDFDSMTDLPKLLRAELKEQFNSVLDITDSTLQIESFKEESDTIDESANVEKVLLEFNNGDRVEAVNMLHRENSNKWSSLCISSQVGCALGCKFCATGQIGFKRNLTLDEIIYQPLYFFLHGEVIHNILFMGMGEPLLNETVFDAIKFFTQKRTFNIGMRSISVSTVGIVPALEKLINEFPQINIAFSLHNPFNNERKELMPITNQYSIEEVMNVLDKHIEKNKRKVFIAYTLLAGINDSLRHAKELVSLIKARGKNSYLYHVNIVPFNRVSIGNVSFKPTGILQSDKFIGVLNSNNINYTIRKSFGRNIDGACGQLYARYVKTCYNLIDKL